MKPPKCDAHSSFTSSFGKCAQLHHRQLYVKAVYLQLTLLNRQTHIIPFRFACEVWLSINDPTECSFFATFWISWSNLTVTSTLLTNYCKHSIHSSLQANGIFHLFSQHPFLSHQKASLYITHTPTSHSNVLLLFLVP